MFYRLQLRLCKLTRRGLLHRRPVCPESANPHRQRKASKMDVEQRAAVKPSNGKTKRHRWDLRCQALPPQSGGRSVSHSMT